jgi:iron-sulfur cluster insertion protein
MSVAETFDPQTIRIGPNAVAKISELVSEEGNPELKLRVYITGGGCSGFQYGFAFEEEVAEDDSVFGSDGATVIIDPMSYQYLAGSELDYTEGLEGARFVISNPNAVTTCGCGASFSL